MAGPEGDAQFQFTGIKKYFNSYTLTGRMNVSTDDTFKQLYFRIIVKQLLFTFSFLFQCVLATYGSIALLILYFKLKPKKNPAVKAT